MGRSVYNYHRYYDPQSGRYVTSDPIGLNGGLNTFGYVGGNPVGDFDPNGLSSVMSPNLWHGFGGRNPYTKDKCDALRKQIYANNLKLLIELEYYNPGLDGKGGWKMAYGSGSTKPGGHYKKIKDFQRGLKNDLEEYNRHCRCGGDDNNPPITRNVDEVANEKIDLPIDPVTGEPFEPALREMQERMDNGEGVVWPTGGSPFGNNVPFYFRFFLRR